MSYNIPIKDYVESLDLCQLENLIEQAKARKDQKDSERKIYVHQVATDVLAKNFRENELEKAIKYIYDYSMKIVNSDQNDRDKVYSLKHVRLNSFKECESEYESWFE